MYLVYYALLSRVIIKSKLFLYCVIHEESIYSSSIFTIHLKGPKVCRKKHTAEHGDANSTSNKEINMVQIEQDSDLQDAREVDAGGIEWTSESDLH